MRESSAKTRGRCANDCPRSLGAHPPRRSHASVLVTLLSGTTLGARPQLGVSVFETPWRDEVWLLSTALAGALLAHILRLPARLLLGPMLASALVHVLGWTRFAPAVDIVNLAQLVLGTTIGCRFTGTPPREIARIITLSLGSTAILLVITGAFAAGMSRVSSYGEVPLLLAYSRRPGGDEPRRAPSGH